MVRSARGDRGHHPWWSTMLFVPVLIACTGDDGSGDGDDLPQCVTLASTCELAYPATFDNVFERTLKMRCGLEGVSCHGNPDGSGAKRGLLIDDADATHARLIDPERERPYAVAGDPACSVLMVRLEVDDDLLRMPPGITPLDARERCSVATWIAEGATR